MFDRKESDKKYAKTDRFKEAQRRYYQKNREKMLEKARIHSKKWYSNPENKLRRKKYNQAQWLRQVKKLEEIAGRPRPERCEICDEIDTICFDHDHKTGLFRGWICKRCNTVLGKVQDNPELLQKLIKFLSVK